MRALQVDRLQRRDLAAETGEARLQRRRELAAETGEARLQRRRELAAAETAEERSRMGRAPLLLAMNGRGYTVLHVHNEVDRLQRRRDQAEGCNGLSSGFHSSGMINRLTIN